MDNSMESGLVKSLERAESLAARFIDAVAENHGGVLYQQAAQEQGNDDNIVTRSNLEGAGRVLAIAKFLSKYISKGDRVAIISNSRPEWMEADLATLILGGVVISVYQSLTPSEIAYILYDSEVSAVFVENQEQYIKIAEILKGSFSIPAVENRAAKVVQLSLKSVISFEEVDDTEVTSLRSIVHGSEVGSELISELRSLYRPIGRDDLASIVYTSGTTGAPKGVMQTHGNHLANIRQAFQAGMYRSDSLIFILLPLAHSFAKLMGYIGFLTPAALLFPRIVDPLSSKADPALVMKDLRRMRPTFVPVVPRLLEKIQGGILGRSEGPGISAKLLRLAISSGMKVHNLNDSMGSASIFDRIIHAATTGIRSKVRNAIFGDRFLFAVSGGAKLSVETAKFFVAMDIAVLEGYGLTETCVATNVNRLGRNKIGTVGPVLAEDIELRLSDDGEICYRGPNIARGYLNRDQATAESWDKDGWFKTGDLGSLDAQGYLSIIGRKKELIVTSGGKKIAPEVIEQRLKAKGLISQAVIIGEGRNYCTALITLDSEQINSWALKQGIELIASRHLDPSLIGELERRVMQLNSELASFETIKRFKVIDSDFSIENGLLTPTLKVKRKRVEERYREEIDEMYRS